MKTVTFVISILAVTLLLGCGRPRITLEVTETAEGNVLFNAETQGRNSYIRYMALWDNPECVTIWMLKKKSGQEADTLKVVYGGEPPTGFYQIVPKDDTKPRTIMPGEIIVVEIFVSFEGLLVPGGTSNMYAFRISEDGRWNRLENYDIMVPDVVGPHPQEEAGYSEEQGTTIRTRRSRGPTTATARSPR